jgi:hypothetical protein
MLRQIMDGKFGGVARLAGGLGVALAFLSGCATEEDRGIGGVPFEVIKRLSATKPPPFLVGPAGVVLTNTADFSARVKWQPLGGGSDVKSFSGFLLKRDTQFFFASEDDEAKGKLAKLGGGISYVWDVAKSSGIVLNEPLQGYAPFTRTNLITDVTFSAAGGAEDSVSGQPCSKWMVKVSRSAGSPVEFAVWRAAALNGFPMRISGPEFAVTFSDVKFERPAEGLFHPPDGFTAYPTDEAMINELLFRQVGGKSRPRQQPTFDSDEPPPPSRFRSY